MRDRKNDQHRKIAERALGRKPRPGFDIDHLNEDKEDNSPANLRETSHSDHSKLTQSKGRRSLRALQRALRALRKGERQY